MKTVIKVLKSIFNITLISTTMVLLYIDFSFDDTQKNDLAQDLQTRLAPVVPKWAKHASHSPSLLNLADKQTANKTRQFHFPESLAKLQHLNSQSCHLPALKEKEHKTQQRIYQWKDEHGKLHFSDRAVHEQAEDISQQYQSRENYISTDILLHNASLPLNANTQITTSITKMFSILSETLEIKQLHQLELSLKVFGERNEFQSYLNNKAPQLKQAMGFYLPANNEASILIQPNAEQTLALIRHETSHVIMANLYGITPLWLNEGFAEYFQFMRISGLQVNVQANPYAIQMLRALVKEPQYSILNHFRLSNQEWQSQHVSLHYAEAWSLVYFLLSSNQGKQFLSSFLHELSQDRCRHPDSEHFFATRYPGGLSQFKSDWLQWLSSKELHPHRY